MKQRFFLAGIFLAVTRLALALELAPPFRLPQYGSAELLGLDDLRGQIVVLDFFNVNCGKCFRTSWEMGSGIQEYYAERGGNAHGIAVQVVAVNSEIADADDLARFTRETELDMALDDPEGTLLRRYGGSSMPYLVVIDATDGGASLPPRVVWRQAKHAGLKNLREIIDAVSGRADEATVAAIAGMAGHEAPPLAAFAQDGKIIQEVTLDTAAMVAADVMVCDLVAEYHLERPLLETRFAMGYRPMRMDFKSSVDGFGRSKRLTAERCAAQGGVEMKLGEPLTLSVDGGVYDGFQTYRALWMDEYYRLRFAALERFGADAGQYHKTDPWGYNAASGLRWEYFEGAGFASAGLSFAHDVVAPGYEYENGRMERLRDTYDTCGGYVSLENVLTRRLRSMLEGRFDDTTARKTRFTLRGALNYAVAENWVVRLAAGYATENPHFTAKTGSVAVERDWRGVWFVSMFGRYYEDTSEVDNGVASFSAAPPLKSYQAGIGVRRQGNSSLFKIDVGPCLTRYEPRAQRNADLDQLYRDRDWFSLQIAFQQQF